MPGAVPETDFVIFGDGIYSCSGVLPTVEHDWEIYHDPPLIFDVLKDPAELHPLVIRHALRLMSEHNKASVECSTPLRWQEIQSTCLSIFESGCRTKPLPLELDSKDGVGNSNSIDQAEER
jgi:hypothetical protein